MHHQHHFLNLIRAALFGRVHAGSIDVAWLTESELSVLDCAGWECSGPTTYCCLLEYTNQLCEQSESDAEDGCLDNAYGMATHTTLACYFSELALLDSSVLKYEPKVVAAAAMRLAREHLGERAASWPEQLAAGMTKADIAACAVELNALHSLYGAGLDTVFFTLNGKTADKSVCRHLQGKAEVSKKFRQEIALIEMQPIAS